MKVVLLSCVAVVLGVVIGVASTAARLGLPGDSGEALIQPRLVSPQVTNPIPPSSGRPKIVVDQENYDFGSMQRGTTLSHTFTFTNAGVDPLMLKTGDTTCKCTISELGSDTLAPGESTQVILQWNSDTLGSYFRQSATIYTNDPQRSRVELTVTGKISETLEFVPQDLVFSKVMAGEEGTGEFRILSHADEPLEILNHRFTDAESADHFTVEFTSLGQASLDETHAESGLLATVRVKPGLPVGRFEQILELTTNIADHAQKRIRIEGVIGSQISIIGEGWDPHQGILKFGYVESFQGASRKLLLTVRGEDREQIELTVARIDPDLLEVQLGEKSSGSIVQIPIIVAIPKGSRGVNYLGSGNAGLGEIVLETNHPIAKQVRIYVQFAVLD